MQKAFAAMQKWRDSHKNVVALGRTVRGLSELQGDKKLKLNKSQAQSVLVVIAKWKGKTALTDAQAKEVNAALKKPLSKSQLQKIDSASSSFGGRRGPGGAPMGAPGGPGGPRAMGSAGAPNRPRQMGSGGPAGGNFRMPAPKDYNPLNPSTMPMKQMQERAQKRMNDLIASLKATK
jgi:hypothetical protein